MSMPMETYHYVIVESFVPGNTSGLHGKVHLRPIDGQIFSTNLNAEGSREMVDLSRHKLGTKFRIRAKLTDRKGGGQYLYSHWSWKFEVL